MTKEAKKFIKECELLTQNVKFIEGPISSLEHYEKLYEPSGGCITGDGFCIFYNKGTFDSGTMYAISEKAKKELEQEFEL